MPPRKPASRRADASIAPGAPAGQAIPALIDRFGPRLHAMALRLCGNRADADDALQDAFLQAFRRWSTFRGDADPGTWLYTIAARACKRRLRARVRDRGTPAAIVHASSNALMPWSETTVMRLAASQEQDPAERRESIERVQHQIARLPEHLRLVVVLRDVLELPVDQAADILGLAPGTIKTRLHRARLALRKAMTAKAPAIHAPAPIYEKQVCLDLLKAKLDAMDRGHTGAAARLPQAEVCARCRAVFRELDLVQEACADMARGEFPPALRRGILAAISQRDRQQAAPAPRRGRRPVKRSKTAAGR